MRWRFRVGIDEHIWNREEGEVKFLDTWNDARMSGKNLDFAFEYGDDLFFEERGVSVVVRD